MQFTRGMFTKRMHAYAIAFFVISYTPFITSCSLQKQIGRSAAVALADSSLLNAHVGISIYEPATGKYWYNYNGDKYFVPASNTKLPTCYAAMKYLGDSLVAGRIEWDKDSILVLHPSGDPTFLHPDFKSQNLYRQLKNYNRLRVDLDFSGFDADPLGSGWSWNDYQEDYMPERSPFPIYGNLVRFDFRGRVPVSIPRVNIIEEEIVDNDSTVAAGRFTIRRDLGSSTFRIVPASHSYVSTTIPFGANNILVVDALGDTLKMLRGTAVRFSGPGNQLNGQVVHSQPTDSLLRLMMHRSDNFFAEQTLLMVSNERLGMMNDSRIIDTLLKTDLKGLPQPPRWADGSGLSRYNLFSPKDFVYILKKMKDEFGMDRLKVILPTGGRGTLSNYYLANKDRIFAKTGTLSGVVALSGFFLYP